MKKKLALVAVSLGIAAGLFWVILPLFAEQTVAAPSQSLDVWQLERDASKQTTRSFDDEHQMHIGVLDILRP